MGHPLRGRLNERLAFRALKSFQSIAHHVGLGATSLAYETLYEERGLRVYPHIEHAHVSTVSQGV